MWTLGTVRAEDGGCSDGLVSRIDPATNAVVDELRVPGITGGDLGGWGRGVTSWGSGPRAGAEGFDPVTMRLGDPASLGGCCFGGPFVPDGAGGAWLVASPNGDAGRSIWHLDASGAVDAVGRVGDDEAFEQICGQSYAFDPETRAIWVQHSRATVARVRLMTAEP